jgi:hypothetical protein
MVPQLQTLCERFLRTYASGRPFLALALAELYHNHELYREASRYVLDQQEWDPAEIEWLSHETTVKLLSRRLWFVERLNKLGNIEPEREYVCVSSTKGNSSVDASSERNAPIRRNAPACCRISGDSPRRPSATLASRSRALRSGACGSSRTSTQAGVWSCRRRCARQRPRAGSRLVSERL